MTKSYCTEQGDRMNLESLKEKIKDFYDEGPEEVFYKVRSWLLSRGFDDDALSEERLRLKSQSYMSIEPE